MSDAELVERFKPRVVYDSLEAFFSDSAAEMTDNPGCTLRAGSELLADASTQPPLTLGFLGGANYATGLPVSEDDRLGVSARDYRSQYVRLITARPELRDRVYGRAKRDSDGRLWLQYWFFYFYNDYNLAARIGLHEGDWEMIQLRIDETAKPPVPDTAVYCQHAEASVRAWDEVTTEEGHPDTPLAFSSRGSHASYFEPGLYETGHWFDVADGKGPRRDLTLELFDESDSGWALWPGRWGDTQPGSGTFGWLLKKAQTASPEAPCSHKQWGNPKKLLDKATHRPRKKPGPPLAVEVDRLGSRLRVKYDLTRDKSLEPPSALVVNVKSEPDDGMPARAFTLNVRGKRKGRWIVPWLKVDPARTYDVLTSLAAEGGAPSPAFHSVLRPEAQRWHRRLLGSIGGFFGGLWQSLGLLRMR
jgi:hypothetical protein